MGFHRPNLLEAGYDIRTVQVSLGHKDGATMMIYTDVLNRGSREVRTPAGHTLRSASRFIRTYTVARPLVLMMNKANITRRVIVLPLLTVLVNASATWAQLGPPKYQLTTSCVTENRGGKHSCWGIIVRFHDARFNKRVRRNQLKVFESKHGANLLDLMTWRTSRDRKQLTIKFKHGTGDFGTANQAEITLYKTAFSLPPKDFPEYLVIVQRTDIN